MRKIMIFAISLMIIFTITSGCFDKTVTDKDPESIADQDIMGTASTAYSSDDILYQVSTINALLEGIYDGDTSYGELKQHGDFGIGTFSGLDGGMIELDGTV